jgi:uncharacterized membrane protein YeiB
MLEPHHPLIEELHRLATERWARRALRTVLQSVSVAIGVWCVGMGARLLWNLEIDVRALTAIALAVCGYCTHHPVAPANAPDRRGSSPRPTLLPQ